MNNNDLNFKINNFLKIINKKPYNIENQIYNLNELIVNNKLEIINEVTKIKFEEDNQPFKCSIENYNDDIKEIFENEPNITFNTNYSNIIFIKVDTSKYKIIKKKFPRSIFQFQKNEIDYVSNYLPNNKYIVFSFDLYNLDEKKTNKLQDLINTIYKIYGNEYELIQIIPIENTELNYKLWNNVNTIYDLLNYRESLIFIKNSSLVIGFNDKTINNVLSKSNIKTGFNKGIPNTIIFYQFNEIKNNFYNEIGIDISLNSKNKWDLINDKKILIEINKILDPNNRLPKYADIEPVL